MPFTASQLADSLQSIGRGDIVDQCLPEDKPLDVTVMTSRLGESSTPSNDFIQGTNVQLSNRRDAHIAGVCMAYFFPPG